MTMSDRIATTPSTSQIRLAPKIRTSEMITPESIKRAMETWNSYQIRYEKLYNYYIGKHTLDNFESGQNLVISNLCYYIVNAIKGYMAGYPPAYANASDDVKADEITAKYQAQNKAKIEAELVQMLSIYGTAYELVYLDAKGDVKSTVFAPTDAFVAYAGDVESDSVFGAIRYVEKDANGNDFYRLYLYTVDTIEVWTSTSYSGPWVKQSEELHGFGRVPLIEYVNNADRMGDFEQIISLQDAYNRLLSNRIDDKDAFVKSILVLTGHILGKTSDEVAEGIEGIKKNRVIQLSGDERSSASYLEKTMDETGVQILQDQLKNDIHKLAMVPDLSDEQFSNNASGVAMAYKLFGTDQRVAEKMANYQAGYTRRCKLYDTALHNSTRSADFTGGADIANMRIIFRLNAPQDLSYMATALTTLVGAGIISKETARSNLLIVNDSDAERELIKAEREEEADAYTMQFEDDYSGVLREHTQPMEPTEDDDEE